MMKKTISKIMVYYTDGTYEEVQPSAPIVAPPVVPPKYNDWRNPQGPWFPDYGYYTVSCTDNTQDIKY